jgi:chemotaxis protein methyltransferase CheR
MSEGSATALLARQFEMTDEDFAVLCELVRRHAGIALSEAKRDLVYGRLSRRLRRLNLGSFREYCGLLGRGGSEVQEFVNAITTNLTAFFREPHHFEHLAREVLPALLRANEATRRIRIWSAGCSTGEEAYSIAMVIREVFADLSGWDVRVLATDLDSSVIATARSGVYPLERLDKVTVQRRERFFEPVAGDAASVAPDVARLVTFKQLNLIEHWPLRGPFDAIFCRNVVIYFDKETQRTLFERFARLQPAGTHLYIGHSETLFRICDRYELIGKSTWRRLP